MITLVLGGARSGKSLVAEQLAARRAAAAAVPVTFVATAAVDPGDPDHRARVGAHQDRRDPAWDTVEPPLDLPGVLSERTGVVLVDSLGTWVASAPELSPDLAALCAALAERAGAGLGDTIVVSEEVGLGVHPSSEAGRRFRDVLGAVNVAVADVADEVLLVVAGRILPLDRP